MHIILTLLLLLNIYQGGIQSQQSEISGNVCDLIGQPLSVVSIELLNMSSGIKQEVRTNTTGKFKFIELKPGKYQISLSTINTIFFSFPRFAQVIGKL